MNFNYQNEYVSQSPLDFNYRFGLNDNSAEKFNYNSISIISSMINNISSNSSFQFSSTLIDASELLVDNTTLEVSSMAVNTISFTKTLSTETLSKLNTKFDTAQFINSILKTTFSGMNNILSNATGNNLANKWTSINETKVTGIDQNVWNKNTNDFETPTSSSSMEIYQVTMSAIGMVSSAISFGFNIANQKSYTQSYSKLIDKKIELLNETITANNEFISQAKDAIRQRQQRFEKSNRLLSM